MDSIPPILNKVNEAVQDASKVTSIATQSLNDQIQTLSQMGVVLQETTKTAQSTAEILAQLSIAPIQRQLSEVKKQYRDLTERFQEKNSELNQLQEDIQTLQKALDDQNKLITQLDGERGSAQSENAELKKIIARQKEKINGFKPKIAELTAKIRFFDSQAFQEQQTHELNVGFSVAPTPISH